MSFLWPTSLLLLGLIPILAAIYIWSLRRRRRYAVRYSSLALIREALPRQSQLRRHLPFALFLLALPILVLALARPVATTLVPAGQATVMMTIDVSRSMLQIDIPPSRLLAAEEAALSFVEGRRTNSQIGIVVFAGFAQQVLPPTTDQESLRAVIESLTTGRGTAIGSGILEAIDAIAEVNPNVPPSNRKLPEGALLTPVTGENYVPDIIVLLTDGVTTTGPLPLDAAQEAVDRGVRIYTIGFGTQRGSDEWYGGGGFNDRGGFGGGGFGGGRYRHGIDEDTLISIAEMTGGAYYTASSASELQAVLESLPTYLITREEVMEITVAFAAIGALLAAAAIVLSLLWHPLP
jgi:Ca-activated chloride channel family protein